MTNTKKRLARWRMHAHFFFFGRPSYDRYYRFIRIQRLRPDARAIRRAARKATAIAIVLVLLTLPIVNVLVASDFAYASFTLNWWNPIALGLWFWYLENNQGVGTPVDIQIHNTVNAAALHHALNLLAIDIGLIMVFSIIVYWTNRNDRSLLSTEKGAADWILTEDLATSGFLPDNYDIYAGFDAPEYDRIAYDANLQAEHLERIRKYHDEVAAYTARMGAADDSAAIVLPIYGENDATRATGATQTDASAPWHNTSTLPGPDPDITVPDFT